MSYEYRTKKLTLHKDLDQHLEALINEQADEGYRFRYAFDIREFVYVVFERQYEPITRLMVSTDIAEKYSTGTEDSNV